MAREKPPSEDQLAERLEQVHLAMIESRQRGIDETPVGKPEAKAPDGNLNAATEMLQLIEQFKHLGISPFHNKQIDTSADAIVTDGLTADDATGELPFGIENRIGRFDIIKRLGQGGYGTVFLARDTNLDREVALKFPRPEVLLTSSLKQRFILEAKSASLLSHPNIVSVYEAGKVGGIYFIAYQYVCGQTLDEWITGHPESLSPKQAAEIVAVLADAVAHAHDRGVIHRDLKPSNVLLEIRDDDGDSLIDQKRGLTSSQPKTSKRSMADRLRIADFGLSKLMSDPSGQTRTGALVGTPAYMAPEQTCNRAPDVGPECDIYSLGVILYELLTGELPFKGATVMETIRAVQQKEPTPPGKLNAAVSRDLEAICLKCLEKEPTRRYPGAFQLQRDLQNYLSGFPVVARPVTHTERLRRWTRRNPAVASLGGLAVGLLLLAIVAMAFGWFSTRSALDRESIAKREAQQRYFEIKQAIDTYFNTVCEDPRIKRLPQTEPLRQELLLLALSYYEQFSQEASNDQELANEVARTHVQIGEIMNELKRPSDAISQFENALELIERQLALASVSSNLTQLKARALDGAARSQFELGDANTSKELNSQAITIIGELIADNPNDRELKRRVAEYENRRGFICYGLHDYQNALHAFRDALDSFSALIKENPEDTVLIQRQLVSKRMTSSSLHRMGRIPEADDVMVEVRNELLELIQRDPTLWDASLNFVIASLTLADIRMMKHDLAGAEQVLQEAQPIAETLSRIQPELPTYLDMKLGTNEKLGIVYIMQGRTESARSCWEHSLDTAEQILKVDPRSVDAIRKVASASMNLASLLDDNKAELGEAEELVIKSQALFQQLAKTSRQSLDSELSLAKCSLALADIADVRHEFEQALQYVNEAMSVCDRLIVDHANHPMVLQLASFTYDKRGRALDHLGRYQEAVADRRRCLELTPPPMKPLLQAALALALIKNGEKDEALEIIAELEANISLQPDPNPPQHIKSLSIRLSQCHSVLAAHYKQLQADERLIQDHVDAAVSYIRLALDQGYFTSEKTVQELKTDEAFDSLCAESEFQAILTGLTRERD